MITWTVNGQPVKLSALTTDLLLRGPRFRALVGDIGEVVTNSFREDLAHEDTTTCAECKCALTDDVFTHARGPYVLCESCVLGVPKQCDCCETSYDLTYLFDRHHVTLVLEKKGA